jgi:glucan phosphorylase
MGHHDLFFKKTFSIRENAADFLQHTLAPELIEEMDLDTLTIEIPRSCDKLHITGNRD